MKSDVKNNNSAILNDTIIRTEDSLEGVVVAVYQNSVVAETTPSNPNEFPERFVVNHKKYKVKKNSKVKA